LQKVGHLKMQMDMRQGILKNKLPVYRENGILYVAYTWTVTRVCRQCQKEVLTKNGRSSTNPLTSLKNFRVCCFEAPLYKPVDRTIHKKLPTHLLKIGYDIETWQQPAFDGTRQHRLKGIGALFPVLPKERWFTSARDFCHAVLDYATPYVGTQDQRVLIQLVSFNGARYDDLFLTENWRNAVEERFHVSIKYSERKSAITHQTAYLPSVTIEWCDVLRFLPPCSLAAATKAYGCEESKGKLPFQVLNDYEGKLEVPRDADGFYSLSYFGGDVAMRQASHEYYKNIVPPADWYQPHDVDLFCRAYCAQA